MASAAGLTGLWLDGWCYLIRTYGADDPEDLDNHVESFEEIAWTEDPGSIVAFAEAYKIRFERLYELGVYQDGDNHAKLVRKMIAAFEKVISKSPQDDRKAREIMFVIWNAEFRQKHRYEARMNFQDWAGCAWATDRRIPYRFNRAR